MVSTTVFVTMVIVAFIVGMAWGLLMVAVTIDAQKREESYKNAKEKSEGSKKEDSSRKLP